MEDIKRPIKSLVFSYVIATICLLLFFTFCLKGSFVYGEDYDQLFFTCHTLKGLYISSDHGCFLSTLYMKIVGSYIPLLFGVHPNDNAFGIFVRALDYIIIFILISRFSAIATKYEKFSVKYFVMSALVFIIFFTLYSWNSDVFGTMFVYNRHSRYIFPVIFYLIFWKSFSKMFLKDEMPKGLNFVAVSLISLCVGLSSEIVSISTFFSLILFFVFKFFISLKENGYKFFEYLKSLLINKDSLICSLKYVTFLSAYSLGCYFLYTNQAFLYLASKRGILTFSKTVNNAINLLPEFTYNWFKEVFIDEYHWILTAFIVIFTITAFVISKDRLKTFKVISFSWILIFGIAMFNFSLIFSGKTCGNNNFWFVCRSLDISTILLLINPLFLLGGYCFNEIDKIKQNKAANIFLNFVFAMLLITAAYFSFVIKDGSFMENKIKLLKARHVMYKAEKMYVFYGERGETAVLPASIKEEKYIRAEVLGLECYSVRISSFNVPYYTFLYHKDKYPKIKLLPDDQAMKEFNSRGGVFEPGEIEKSEFTKLFDKDFVLNTKNSRIKT